MSKQKEIFDVSLQKVVNGFSLICDSKKKPFIIITAIMVNMASPDTIIIINICIQNLYIVSNIINNTTHWVIHSLGHDQVKQDLEARTDPVHVRLEAHTFRGSYLKRKIQNGGYKIRYKHKPLK